MPPTRTPSRSTVRTGGARPPAGKKPPTDGKPPGGGGSRFSRAFGRFGGAPREGGRTRGSLLTLLRDVRQELKKVEWPSREEATKLTAAVVGLSAAVGLFLGGVDFVFQELFKILIGLTGGGA